MLLVPPDLPSDLSPFSPGTFFFEPTDSENYSSRSSVCTEFLGCGAVHFGTAAFGHNDSGRSDSRMYRNTRLHGVSPQKTAVLVIPPNFPIYRCPNHPLSLRHHILRHSSASEIYRIRHDSFHAFGPSSSLQIAAKEVVLCRPKCYEIFIAVSNIRCTVILPKHRSRIL
jgi:hypothetical protein